MKKKSQKWLVLIKVPVSEGENLVAFTLLLQ